MRFVHFCEKEMELILGSKRAHLDPRNWVSYGLFLGQLVPKNCLIDAGICIEKWSICIRIGLNSSTFGPLL
jgi:hypothetical protein